MFPLPNLGNNETSAEVEKTLLLASLVMPPIPTTRNVRILVALYFFGIIQSYSKAKLVVLSKEFAL